MKDRLFDENPYCPQGYVDCERNNALVDGSWRSACDGDSGLEPIGRVSSNNYSKNAKDVRDTFCNYVNSYQGQVSWQSDMVSVKQV